MNAPTSGGDRLAGGSIFAAFDQLRREGLVQHLGLTGIGHPAALHEVIDSGRFATVQTPYSLLNPSAGQKVGAHFAEHDYGNLIAACQRHGMGVFAIRVFAAGALLGHAPSAHTVRTKFFPLDLYRRDARRGKQLEARLRLQRHDLNSGHDLTSTALRFVLSHPGISSAIVGLGAEEHVDVAAGASDAGPLEASMLEPLTQWATSPAEDPGESHDG
jgi:aryl-alcohol dehydrogenase-like predicted oxidoreductase